MPKSKSSRLLPVVELAQRQEDQAAKALMNARRYFEQQNGQLLTLQNYLSEYIAKMKNDLSGVRSVAELQQNQRFMQQINDAIKQQELAVNHAKVQFDEAKTVWIKCKDKKDSLSDIQNKAKQAEQLDRDKQLEKLLQDEYQSRRAY